MVQLTFAESKYDRKKRRAQREVFLKWLENRGRLFYPRAGRGRQPYPLT